MHLLAPSILQKLKILRTDPELQPKIGQFVLNKLFLVQTIIITFIFLLVLLIVQNFKNFLLRIQSYEDVPFLGPKWSICHNFFFWKLLMSFSSTYQPFHCAKFFQRIQIYQDMQFWVQNGTFPQMRFFSPRTC